MKQNEKSIWDKLHTIDRRYIYVVTLVLVVIPLINPIGLPIVIYRWSEDWYNYIEELPDGSVVLLECSFDTSFVGTLMPGTAATIYQILENDLKLVAYSLHGEGPITFDMSMSAVPQSLKDSKEYGVDWVYLGYAPGGETAQLKMGEDVWGLFPTDYYGTPVNELPIMADVKSYEDTAAVIVVTRGGEYQTHTYRVWSETYHHPLLVHQISATVSVELIESGLVTAILRSSRGAAEYELLLGQPGLAVAAQDSKSVYFIWVIICIAVGNIAFFLRKKEEQ